MRRVWFVGLIVVVAWVAFSLPRSPVFAQAAPFGEAFQCIVTTSTATTVQAVGAPCIGIPDSSLYITDVFFSASATGIAADAFPTLKYGTGTTCGTGTTVVWGALTAAAFAQPHALTTALRIPKNNDLCWISSTAGSKFLVITGYRAP